MPSRSLPGAGPRGYQSLDGRTLSGPTCWRASDGPVRHSNHEPTTNWHLGKRRRRSRGTRQPRTSGRRDRHHGDPLSGWTIRLYQPLRRDGRISTTDVKVSRSVDLEMPELDVRDLCRAQGISFFSTESLPGGTRIFCKTELEADKLRYSHRRDFRQNIIEGPVGTTSQAAPRPALSASENEAGAS